MTEKKEQYIKNAGVAGSIPTHEDYGKANGRIRQLTISLTPAQLDFVEQIAKEEGISIDEAISKIVRDRAKKKPY